MRLAFAPVLVVLACRPVHDPGIPDALVIPLTSTTYHLTNGMKVIVVPEPKADLVTVFARYEVGAIDDPPDQPGMAHLAAHLTYTQLATPTLTLWDALDRSATWLSVTPTSNRTEFLEQCEPAQLALVLRLEALRLAGCATITPAWFDNVRRIVADELAGNGSLRTDRAIAHVLYPIDDPFARTYDADDTTVARLTQEQACAFMAAHYAPANTEITISGPIDPARVESMLQAELGRVPPRTVAARAARPQLPQQGLRAAIHADVSRPSVLVAWPVPDDRAARAMTAYAIQALADELGAKPFSDDHYLGLWFERNNEGIDSSIARLREALEHPQVRDFGFAFERTKLLTQELATLDLVAWRAADLSRGLRLDTTLAALAKLTPHKLENILERDLQWSRARVLRLEPGGSRPAWSPTEVADPAHSLRETSNAPDLHDVPFAAPDVGVLARARAFTLPNGLTVVLAPTSPVPLVQARLVFPAGNAAAAHAGTASVAIAALGDVAWRGGKADPRWASISQWHTSLDSVRLDVRGPFMYADLVFERFAGLAHDHLRPDDVQRGFAWMKRVAKAPQHSSWDIDRALRSSVYGEDHPYAHGSSPEILDVQGFDPAEVERFYASYLQPDHATLIVTGGFDPDVVARIVERVFAGWHGRSQSVAAIAPHGAGGRFASERPGDVVALQIQWSGPALDDHVAAREVLGEMVMSVAPQFYSKWEQLAQGGRYVLYGKLPLATAPQQIAEIARRLETIGSGSDADRATFIAARRHGARWRIGASLTAEQWSDAIWLAFGNGRDLAWLRSLPARKGSVSYDEVAQLAKAELAPGRATWHVAGPRDAVTAVYQALGVEPKWFER